MNNEIQRKITSLTLMTIMLAGGMAIAAPGTEPAYAANPHLTVSAEAVGNFAGIQVIEIVVNDPERISTSESEGIPNVEINNKDVRMVQGTDGAWYAYVANQIAIDTFETLTSDGNIKTIYGNSTNISRGDANTIPNTDARAIIYEVRDFLDGYKAFNEPSGNVDNNIGIVSSDWPFIQTYDIADNTQVTITYGTGGTAQSTSITYDYDDSKDITLDRTRYPALTDIIFSLDDSLLNLSPVANDYWGFNGTGAYYFQDHNSTLIGAIPVNWSAIGFEEGPLTFDAGSSNIFSIVNATVHDTIHAGNGDPTNALVIVGESIDDDNIFVNYGTNDISNIKTNSDDSVTGSGKLSYNTGHSVILDTFDGVISLDVGVSEWLSGVELKMTLVDEDRNLNSRIDETISIVAGEVPYIKIGNPLHLDSTKITNNSTGTFTTLGSLVESTDSKVFTVSKLSTDTAITINGTWPYPANSNSEYVFSYANLDFTALNGGSGTFYMGSEDGSTAKTGTLPTNVAFSTDPATNTFEIEIGGLDDSTSGNVYFDVLSFGQEGALTTNNGEIDDNVSRVNDAFYRFTLDETDDNTASFTGSLEYIMINQLNVFDIDTYDSIKTADDGVIIIVNDDMDGTDAVRVSYNDVISTGNDETISVQEDANTHSGTITFDSTGYSAGSTITVTISDVDLNTDSETPQIYQTSNPKNWIGNENVWLSQLTFDDKIYAGCGTAEYPLQKNFALNNTSFSFIETDDASGIFVGTLKLPTNYCDTTTSNSTTNGVDMKFEYQDYSDASGNPNETSTSAAIRSVTGFVDLDNSVYGIPFGLDQYATHAIDPKTDLPTYLSATPTTFTITVNDPDYNISANGEDTMPNSVISLEIKRGADTRIVDLSEFGPLVETDPKSGIFELEVQVHQGSSEIAKLADGGYIKQGDIILVEYTDENDASGETNTVTDSATFDLRNAVLQSDKPVYIIGTDAIITLIEPDLNLDSGTEETLSLDLIEWDSDAGTTTLENDIFNAQPAGLRETGPNTGIFQVVIEIPTEVDPGDKMERGEQITLEYVDQGPAGADFIGDDSEDILVDIYTSNFGATIELDQKVYTWTDKVYITVVSPDHNFDSNSIDEIGGADKIVQVSTRGDKIKNYKFVETGPDTGIFTGEVILTGFSHDTTGDGVDNVIYAPPSGNGPTDGKISADDDDGLTISFESSDNDVVTGTALIRWNIGEVQFLEASYPATGSGLVRVIDPDVNLNPESVDSFNINVWSDSSAGGIALRVTETNEATGIFEGTMFFTVSDSSSGSRLRVAEGDTVTAEYEDNTLPDPYTTADELDITATTLIGTIVPPLERSPAGNLRAVDAFKNSLTAIQIDQQVQLTADVSNNQDRNQEFAYLVQIQDEDGVTVSLSWITGEFAPGQQLSPAVSWIPEFSGTYTATVFVWQSVDNPTALSPPVSTDLIVN